MNIAHKLFTIQETTANIGLKDDSFRERSRQRSIQGCRRFLRIFCQRPTDNDWMQQVSPPLTMTVAIPASAIYRPSPGVLVCLGSLHWVCS